MYSVWLCHDGEFVQVVLDDLFPCGPANNLLFSRSNGNELWVLLLEKAYAKVYGRYDKIVGGIAAFALRELTGAPYEFFYEDDK